MKRVIQQHVENALARGILRGDWAEGDTVLVDTDLTGSWSDSSAQLRLTFRKAFSNEGFSDSPPALLKY